MDNLTLEIHSTGNGPARRRRSKGPNCAGSCSVSTSSNRCSTKWSAACATRAWWKRWTMSNCAIDAKADFLEEANLKPVFEKLKALGLNPEMRRDEEHSTYAVVYKDQTQAERSVGVGLLSQPEYRRFRTLVKTIARHNDPPFVVVKGPTASRSPIGAVCSTTSKPRAKKAWT